MEIKNATVLHNNLEKLLTFLPTKWPMIYRQA